MFATPAAGVGRYSLIALFVFALWLTLTPSNAYAAYIGWYEYSSNGTNTNGNLSWNYTLGDMPPVRTISWRAGSGQRHDDGPNGGWIPSGWYSIRGHWNNYNGSSIYGRVWYLSNHYDSNGNLRTALFIHTEETPSNGQSATYEPQRWDGDSDYNSLGCIKIAYGSNLNLMHSYWNNYGGSTAHGSSSPYPLASKLYVY
jgi:hypothetical protein